MRSLVGDALSNLSRIIPRSEQLSLAQTWASFRNQMLLVGVSDPTGAGGESSPIYTRIAKVSHGFPPENILHHTEAIQRVKDVAGTVVFIDDSIGSGQQFSDFWNHKWNKDDSFASVTQTWRDMGSDYAQPQFFYIPIIAHSSGIEEINEKCPEVEVLPVYRIDDTYSARNPDSIIWNNRFKKHEIDSFVARNSATAGIREIWGHHQLALCVILETGVPDFTLPLLTHSSPTWNPLVKQL